MGAALADDLSSTARVRRETPSRFVVKLTGNICVSELRKINMVKLNTGFKLAALLQVVQTEMRMNDKT